MNTKRTLDLIFKGVICRRKDGSGEGRETFQCFPTPLLDAHSCLKLKRPRSLKSSSGERSRWIIHDFSSRPEIKKKIPVILTSVLIFWMNDGELGLRCVMKEARIPGSNFCSSDEGFGAFGFTIMYFIAHYRAL